MNSQILSSDIYHLLHQLKNTWLLSPIFKEIFIWCFWTYCLNLLPTLVMIICFSIIPFLIAYHYCVLINKWEVFWHWFNSSRYDSFWESVMLPHFSGDKLNSDEVCDSPKSLYCPKVSFQRSEMRESRLNFLLIWAQAVFFGPVPMSAPNRPAGFFLNFFFWKWRLHGFCSVAASHLCFYILIILSIGWLKLLQFFTYMLSQL